MSVPRLLLPILAALVMAGTTRCGAGRDASPEPAPWPPYQVVAPDRLRVRADLAGLLRTAPVARSDVQAVLQGYGRVGFAANAAYAVRVAFPAFVERVHVVVGATVRPGQALATLRSVEVARLRAEVRRLMATIAGERDAVTRLERLVPQGVVANAELVAARAHLLAVQEELRGVQGALDASGVGVSGGDVFVLRAAAGGEVLARTIDPGERIAPDTAAPALMIGDPAAVVVRAAFPERDAPWITEGAPCTFTVPALGADRFEGTIANVTRAVDATTHTAAAACRPRAEDPRLRAEMVARVELPVRGAAALTVPRSAVLLRRDDRVVFVQTAPAELERRVVEVGGDVGDRVRVLAGLREGEQVVVENAVLLDGELDVTL